MATFTELAAALTTKGARLDMEMVALGDGRFQVRITPNLGPCPINASDEEVQVRSLMGVPMTLTDTPDEIDEALHERITQHLEVQAVGVSALDAYREKMSKAADAAKKATPKNSASNGKSSTAKGSSQDQPADEGKVQRNDTKAPSLEDF